MIQKVSFIFKQFFCILLALQILNCSVDVPDTNKNSFSEDLSINDMESIVEIVLEKFLGFDNSVKEFDDCDQDSFQLKKGLDLYVKPQIQISRVEKVFFKVKPQKTFFAFRKVKSHNQDITTPPPRQLFS